MRCLSLFDARIVTVRRLTRRGAGIAEVWDTDPVHRTPALALAADGRTLLTRRPLAIRELDAERRSVALKERSSSGPNAVVSRGGDVVTAYSVAKARGHT